MCGWAIPGRINMLRLLLALLFLTGTAQAYEPRTIFYGTDRLSLLSWIQTEMAGYPTQSQINAQLAGYVTSSTYAAGMVGVSASLALKANAADLANYVSISTYTAGLATKANVSHTHVISDVTGLQAALDAKASAAGLAATQTSLTIVQGNITNILVSTTSLASSITSLQASISASGITVYSGTSQLSSPKMILKTGAVNSGTAVFYLTNDNTASGTALMANPVGVNVDVNASDAAYGTSWAFSNVSRTLTVTVVKPGSLLGLGLIPYTAAANGVNVNVRVFGN